LLELRREHRRKLKEANRPLWVFNFSHY
jgi:hypothetical protein